MWDIGYSFGAQRTAWPRMVAVLRSETGHFLTGAERAQLAAGWREGQRDRRAYETDMKAGDVFQHDPGIPL